MHVNCASFPVACGYIHAFLFDYAPDVVYCNKRLFYKQVWRYCLYFKKLFAYCRRVMIAFVVSPIKYGMCRMTSAARCWPGRCCASYLDSGREK